MSVTLKDIAREAGVYPSLVSAVLNNGRYTRISSERRAEIKAIAERMGFRPNLQASCLRKGKKSLVGVFLPMWEDVLFIELIRGLSQEANELDIPLSFHFGMKPEHYEKFLKNTLELRHTGIISYGFSQNDAGEAARIGALLEDYIKDGGKVISIVTGEPLSQNAVTLHFDNAEGGRLAARYLASRSCRSYATFVYGKQLVPQRCRPFAEELKKLVPDITPADYIVDSPMPRSEWTAAIDSLFDAAVLPVGIFVAKGGDFCNYLITRALERGLRPEKDFFVAAYDHPARYGDCYPIARIIQPFCEIGALAVRKFDELRSGRSAGQEKLAPSLFVPSPETDTCLPEFCNDFMIERNDLK